MATKRSKAKEEGGQQPQGPTTTEVDGKPKRSKSEQLRAYKGRYETYQAPNGNLSMDNGDAAALKLRGASPEVVMRAAEKLRGLEPGTLTERYAARNNGAKRMNAGNIIRGCLNRDKTVQDLEAALKSASAEINKAS
jgi:hypothetical protein